MRELSADIRGSSGDDDRNGTLPAAGDGGLGMSYELADVLLADVRGRIWILTKVTFTGAAILRRSKAAYEDTWIALGR
jgi:hypothetical protein